MDIAQKSLKFLKNLALFKNSVDFLKELTRF